MTNEIETNLYLTYIRKCKEVKCTPIGIDGFKELIGKSRTYIEKLVMEKDVCPFIVLPIDGKLFLLVQIVESNVKIGIHSSEAINKILGKSVLEEAPKND